MQALVADIQLSMQSSYAPMLNSINKDSLQHAQLFAASITYTIGAAGKEY